MNTKEYTKRWRARNPNYQREYYLKNKGRLLSRNKEYAKTHKGEIQFYLQEYVKDPQHRKQASVRAREYYLKHKAELMERQRDNNAILKSKVLVHYGNGKLMCVICGEDRLACLSLDHIDNSGAAHRKGLGREGMAFYRWVKKQGYPQGYQTLCMNCQWVKQDKVYKSKHEPTEYTRDSKV